MSIGWGRQEGRKEGSKVNGMDLRGVMVGNGESVSLCPWGWHGSGLGRSVGSVGSLKPFHLSPYPIPFWSRSPEPITPIL